MAFSEFVEKEGVAFYFRNVREVFSVIMISSLNQVHFKFSLLAFQKQELRQKIGLLKIKIAATSFEAYQSEFYSNDYFSTLFTYTCLKLI